MFKIFLAVLMGMFFYRLILSGTVGLYAWKEKILNYLIAPIILGFAYMGFMALLKLELVWNMNMFYGSIIGMIAQHFIMKKREAYFSEVKDSKEK